MVTGPRVHSALARIVQFSRLTWLQPASCQPYKWSVVLSQSHILSVVTSEKPAHILGLHKPFFG